METGKKKETNPIKKIYVLTFLLLILVGCQKQKIPDMKPPKGGFVEYYYDEGGEIYYGGTNPLLGPFNAPQKDLEEQCNFYLVNIKDKEGIVIRNIVRDHIHDQWNITEFREDGSVKNTFLDGEMNFLSADINYFNEQNRVTKHVLLNEDDSVVGTEITVYLEDGITYHQVFYYNEKGELDSFDEYLPPSYNEFIERDVSEAPSEYLKLK